MENTLFDPLLAESADVKPTDTLAYALRHQGPEHPRLLVPAGSGNNPPWDVCT